MRAPERALLEAPSGAAERQEATIRQHWHAPAAM